MGFFQDINPSQTPWPITLSTFLLEYCRIHFWVGVACRCCLCQIGTSDETFTSHRPGSLELHTHCVNLLRSQDQAWVLVHCQHQRTRFGGKSRTLHISTLEDCQAQDQAGNFLHAQCKTEVADVCVCAVLLASQHAKIKAKILK